MILKTMLQTTPILTAVALLALTAAAPARQGIAPPDNGPATVAWDAASGRLTLEYHGGAILSATLTANDAAGKAVAVKLDQQTDRKDDKVTQNLTFTPDGPDQGVMLTLSGEITGSAEAFATEKVWQGSLTGYCTWWSYRGDFTQRTLDAMLGVFAAKRLPDFGYDYMQFDDAYQQGNGSCPENFLNWDTKKFPGGSQ
jgi:hypothetical protein